jgi:hypothetical protein
VWVRVGLYLFVRTVQPLVCMNACMYVVCMYVFVCVRISFCDHISMHILRGGGGGGKIPSKKRYKLFNKSFNCKNKTFSCTLVKS